MGLLRVLFAGLPPAQGEGLALRWLRKLDEHPVRGAAAVALAAFALGVAPRGGKEGR